MHTSTKDAMEHEMGQCHAESTKGRREENGAERRIVSMQAVYIEEGRKGGEEILEH
jgi:hypothetical protein